MKINFIPFNQETQLSLIYSVIISFYKSKFVFVRHKERNTWEFPGGTIEKGESSKKAAARELNEETGATIFKLIPYSIYSVETEKQITYGGLFFSNIETIAPLNPDFEIQEIGLFDELPEKLTYPEIINAMWAEMKKKNILRVDALNWDQ
ncbi:MAG: NUDIX domain-containing protein [Bacteroidales bacterium]